MKNTRIDPGFRGYVTLELTYHGSSVLELYEGVPICQVEFALLLMATDMPYSGRYQDQPDEPVGYHVARDAWK